MLLQYYKLSQDRRQKVGEEGEGVGSTKQVVRVRQASLIVYLLFKKGGMA